MFWTIDADRRGSYYFSNAVGPQLNSYPVCLFLPRRWRQSRVRGAQNTEGDNNSAIVLPSAGADRAGKGVPCNHAQASLTQAAAILTLGDMEVHLLQNQEVQLNELAAQTGRGTDELVQEAVAKLRAHNEWFKAQVQIGVDQIARGEFIEEEEMDARVERMLQS